MFFMFREYRNICVTTHSQESLTSFASIRVTTLPGCGDIEQSHFLTQDITVYVPLNTVDFLTCLTPTLYRAIKMNTTWLMQV